MLQCHVITPTQPPENETGNLRVNTKKQLIPIFTSFKSCCVRTQSTDKIHHVHVLYSLAIGGVGED